MFIVVHLFGGSIAMLRHFFRREEAQGLVEYAMLLLLMALVVIGIVTLIGQKTSELYTRIEPGFNPP
jgi:pilus assembly protein Flp/PilA